EDEVLRRLHGCDTDRLDGAGQPPLGGVNAVLNVDRRQIRIAGQVKSGSNVAGSIIAARRGDVFHSLGAVDLLFQGDGNCAFDGLRAGADVKTGDPNLRRSQVGELSDGKRGNYCCARQNDQQRANRGKHRTMDKEIYEHEAGLYGRKNALPMSLARRLLQTTRNGKLETGTNSAESPAPRLTEIASPK